MARFIKANGIVLYPAGDVEADGARVGNAVMFNVTDV